jgi:hypothetical protein
LLLRWGRNGNLLWSWQVTQIIPVAIVCGVLAIIAAYGLAPPAAVAAAAVAVATLPLCGIPGLATEPALASWSGIVRAVAFETGVPSPRQPLGRSAAVTLILAVLYLCG